MKQTKRPPTAGMLKLLREMEAGAKLYHMEYMGRFNPNAYYFVINPFIENNTTEEAK